MSQDQTSRSQAVIDAAIAWYDAGERVAKGDDSADAYNACSMTSEDLSIKVRALKQETADGR